jgi:hypothetical protein
VNINSYEDEILSDTCANIEKEIFTSCIKAGYLKPEEHSIFFFNVIAHLSAGSVFKINAKNRKKVLKTIFNHTLAVLEEYDKQYGGENINDSDSA